MEGQKRNHRRKKKEREVVRVFTREAARILGVREDLIRVLIYEVSKENWGNAGILGLDMK